MGPSGSGKSVLLKLIAGLEQPTEGDIKIQGLSVNEAKKKWVVALVFQAGALFNSINVFDNLALYPREHQLYTEEEIEKRVLKTLDMLSLKNAAYKMPSELSGGMRKRVAIARGLMMEPDLMLYDEPTSELDPITGASIVEIIGIVSRQLNITTIVVSHEPKLALSIGDRVAILNKGNIEQLEIPENLVKSSNPFVKEFLNPVINLENPRFRSS